MSSHPGAGETLVAAMAKPAGDRILRSEAIAPGKPETGAAKLLRSIFGPGGAPRFGPLEAVVFIFYLALLAWTMARHVPWVDEAQGWLVARDSSLADLFNLRLRYEGSPGLWHLLLWILCRLHFSFTAMRWIASVVPAAGIYVFLRYSPFPAILRVILPFSFYLGYQYAVISRNYVAAPLLIFVCAVLFAKPARNLVSLAVALGLLSNLCAQGLVISAAFAAMIALRLWRGSKSGGEPLRLRRLVAASICLCSFWAVSVWSTRPASDDIYTPAWRATHLEKKPAGARAPSAPAPAGPSAGDETEAATKPVGHGTLRHAAERFEDSVTYGLSNSWLISLAAWCIVAAFLVYRKQALDLLPFLLLQALFEFVAARPWHFGMVLLALLAVLWIDWPLPADSHAPAWRAILSMVLLAIAGEQCLWTVRAVRTDLTGKYSGDRDAAEYLAGRIAGKTVAGFQYYSVGVLPYFSSNIFENQPKEAFWNFSKSVDVDAHLPETLQRHPDIIDVGFAVRPPDARGGVGAPTGLPQTFEPRVERMILATGLYRETHRFCGDAFSGHGYHEGLCQVILERSAH